jgi:hypothetical protein
LHAAHKQDYVEPFTTHDVDGVALRGLQRAGETDGPCALHTLLRGEFPQARAGHRLRLVEGLAALSTVVQQ